MIRAFAKAGGLMDLRIFFDMIRLDSLQGGSYVIEAIKTDRSQACVSSG